MNNDIQSARGVSVLRPGGRSPERPCSPLRFPDTSIIFAACAANSIMSTTNPEFAELGMRNRYLDPVGSSPSGLTKPVLYRDQITVDSGVGENRSTGKMALAKVYQFQLGPSMKRQDLTGAVWAGTGRWPMPKDILENAAVDTGYSIE